jgi:hypothetical protein
MAPTFTARLISSQELVDLKATSQLRISVLLDAQKRWDVIIMSCRADGSLEKRLFN